MHFLLFLVQNVFKNGYNWKYFLSYFRSLVFLFLMVTVFFLTVCSSLKKKLYHPCQCILFYSFETLSRLWFVFFPCASLSSSSCFFSTQTKCNSAAADVGSLILFSYFGCTCSISVHLSPEQLSHRMFIFLRCNTWTMSYCIVHSSHTTHGTFFGVISSPIKYLWYKTENICFK